VKNKLVTNGVIGKYIDVCYPEVEIVQYSIVVKNTRVIFGLEYSQQPLSKKALALQITEKNETFNSPRPHTVLRSPECHTLDRNRERRFDQTNKNVLGITLSHSDHKLPTNTAIDQLAS